jgi:hypothetical protein
MFISVTSRAATNKVIFFPALVHGRGGGGGCVCVCADLLFGKT